MILWSLRVLLSLVVPSLMLFTGFSSGLRDFANRFGQTWFLTIAIYIVLLTILLWVISLPMDFYQGFVREHRFGLSNQSPAKWFSDSVKTLAVSLVIGIALGWIPYALLRASPNRWWLVTSLVAVPVYIFMTLIEPIWIAPLFNKFGPMKDKALEQELLSLAARAGIDKTRVFEVDKSVDTKKVNAYVAGLFGTRRIVLWDTLLQKLNREQVLFVMAHEMAHYVLGHVWKTLAAVSLLTPLALYLVHRASKWMVSAFKPQLGFETVQDIASLPLFLLLINVFSLFIAPVVNAYSRSLEKEADTFALELTRNNYAAGTALVALATDNLVHPRPGSIYKIWLSTHPPLAERVDFCNNYAPWREGKRLRYRRYFTSEATD